jgi:hypothetical protein
VLLSSAGSRGGFLAGGLARRRRFPRLRSRTWPSAIASPRAATRAAHQPGDGRGDDAGELGVELVAAGQAGERPKLVDVERAPVEHAALQREHLRLARERVERLRGQGRIARTKVSAVGPSSTSALSGSAPALSAARRLSVFLTIRKLAPPRAGSCAARPPA